jgi:hypothetical protein
MKYELSTANLERAERVARILGMDDATGHNGKRVLTGRSYKGLLSKVCDGNYIPAAKFLTKADAESIVKSYDGAFSDSKLKIAEAYKNQSAKAAEYREKAAESTAKGHDGSTYALLAEMAERSAQANLEALDDESRRAAGIV